MFPLPIPFTNASFIQRALDLRSAQLSWALEITANEQRKIPDPWELPVARAVFVEPLLDSGVLPSTWCQQWLEPSQQSREVGNVISVCQRELAQKCRGWGVVSSTPDPLWLLDSQHLDLLPVSTVLPTLHPLISTFLIFPILMSVKCSLLMWF